MIEQQAAQLQQIASPHRHTNRLIRATSPYLLQHAHNPVDWYEWGAEAFEAARQADKPIFLSVGYSTCYWCHVMERESFESEAIAAIMNEHFICIKVDREERPDVDDIYMSAVQTFTQLTEGRASGGWPMSVFLEPKSLKPFYAGTYYPPEPRFGRPSFPQLLQFVAQTWDEKRDDIVAQADQIAAIVEQQLSVQAAARTLDNSVVDSAVNQLMRIYDPADAGFGRAPKFPQPVFLELLLACAWERDEARRAVLQTLDRMAIGGMYDQIGGGFHRYSTDANWLVPHFEKMLYDNGQLVSVYAEAFARTDDAFYAEIVRETLDYVLREMTAPGGGFYSAQDAEVDAREGLNYLWTGDQVRAALSDAGLDDFVDFTLEVYGFNRGTNFQDPHHPEDPPANVVFLIDRTDVLAKKLGISIEEFNARIEKLNAALLAVRSKRKAPGTDDKILAGWNGLMIAGFADAGRILNEPRYVAAAERAAKFILENMRSESGGLLRTSRNGMARIDAFLEDYALLIRGLLALHRAAGDAKHLEAAIALADDAKARFGDTQHGGYFDTLADQADLFVRTKSSYDGAVPSGNGVMALNLLDLHDLTGTQQYLDNAVGLLRGLSGRTADGPLAAALSTIAVQRVMQIDADALRAAERPVIAGPMTIDPVAISLSQDSIALDEKATAEIVLSMQIEEPYHINAHKPGQERLIGLKVELQGAEGIEIETSYPAGELYRDEIRIHRGRVEIPIRITRTDPISGTSRLAVTYQVCTDEVCLRPTTKTIPLTITGD